MSGVEPAARARTGAGILPGPKKPATAGSAACEDLVLENAVLRGQIATLGGETVEWPSEVSTAFREEALAPWLAQATAGMPVETLALDCAEYPCIAAFRFAEGQSASSAVLDPLRAQFLERTDAAGRARVHVHGTETTAFAALSFGPADDDALAERLALRMKEMVEAEMQP